MPLADFTEVAERVQRALAANAELVNQPGGVAYKLDPELYLVLWPQFAERLASVTGMLPETIAQGLCKTGYLVSFAPPAGSKAETAANHASNLTPGRLPAVKLQVVPGPGRAVRNVLAGFLAADFVERGLVRFDPDSWPGSVGLSGLQLAASERRKVQAFFGPRVPPSSLAYSS